MPSTNAQNKMKGRGSCWIRSPYLIASYLINQAGTAASIASPYNLNVAFSARQHILMTSYTQKDHPEEYLNSKGGISLPLNIACRRTNVERRRINYPFQTPSAEKMPFLSQVHHRPIPTRKLRALNSESTVTIPARPNDRSDEEPPCFRPSVPNITVKGYTPPSTVNLYITLSCVLGSLAFCFYHSIHIHFTSFFSL